MRRHDLFEDRWVDPAVVVRDPVAHSLDTLPGDVRDPEQGTRTDPLRALADLEDAQGNRVSSSLVLWPAWAVLRRMLEGCLGVLIDATTANQTVNISLAAATIHTISGTLTAGATHPVGAVVWVYDAVTSAFVNAAYTGAGGAYSIPLPAGTYKLWITGVAGYLDQAYGPDGTLANATVIDATTADQTVNITFP